MRIGNNPQRDVMLDKSNYLHQIIMPVYIPHLNDYYKESFEVLKLSLQSLFKTVYKQTHITVVANGCCDEVYVYLNNLYQEKKIQELIITSAIGKVNAILKGLAGSMFRLVTITDADVLFCDGWQKATYEVFNNFSKAGVVGLVPNPGFTFYKTANIFRSHILFKKIHVEKIKNKEALVKFGISIGKEDVFKKFETYYTISNNGVSAVLGAGHFVATYKTDIFNFNFERTTKFALGGDSESRLLDDKALQVDLWRLSTYDNFAFHMGNTVEKWYEKHVEELAQETNLPTNFPEVKVKSPSKIKKLYYKVVNVFFSSFKVRNWILKYNVKKVLK